MIVVNEFLSKAKTRLADRKNLFNHELFTAASEALVSIAVELRAANKTNADALRVAKDQAATLARLLDEKIEYRYVPNSAVPDDSAMFQVWISKMARDGWQVTHKPGPYHGMLFKKVTR